MRAAVPLTLALALLPGASAGVPVHVEFADPAQATGSLGLDGLQWALLVFHAPAEAAFHLGLDGPVAVTNDTVVQHKQSRDAPAGLAVQQPAPLRQTSTVPGPLAGGLDLSLHPWSSLYVEAEHITLAADVANAAVRRADGERPPSAFLPRAYFPASATSPAEPPHGVAVGAQGDSFGAPVAIRVAARGVRHVLWHNATLACEGGGACPDSGAPWSAAVPTGPAGTALVQRLSYVSLAGPAGWLDGGGQAWAIAAGGAQPDLSVAGDLRLRDAALAGECADGPCPDPRGRTLRAAGDLVLAGLGPHPSDPGRLQAGLEGTFRAAAFDEAPAAGFTPVGAVAAAGLAIALAAKVAFALFARSARPPALQHPRRRAAFEAIRAQPGLSFRALRRSLGWPNGPLQNHLNRLIEAGLIVAQRHANTVRYFENHGRYERTWRPLAQLHDPRARRLHDWLAANPGVRQGPVVEEAPAWGWSRTATQRLLRNLASSGLLSARRAGRSVAYVAMPPPGPPPAL